jgi:hypothetical protein
MKKGTLALFLLLAFASHGTWCAVAGRSVMADAAHHHLRPHLQVQAQGLLGKYLACIDLLFCFLDVSGPAFAMELKFDSKMYSCNCCLLRRNKRQASPGDA